VRLSKNKELKLRRKINFLELNQRKLKFLFINTVNTTKEDTKKKFLLAYFSKLLKTNSTKVKAVRRCVLTNRARVSHRDFKISRVKLKEYLSLGLIPGYKKAVW
jgi:ribosomal protein S14